MEIEADESDFVSVSSSQESLLRRKEFTDEDNEDNAGITGDKGSQPAESTPILMISPPTSSEPNDVAAPNDDVAAPSDDVAAPNEDVAAPNDEVFQTPPEEALPHSAASSQSIDRHEMVVDPNLGIGLSPERTQELEEARARVSEKEPVAPSHFAPPAVGNPIGSSRKKMKIPLREVVRAIVRNSGKTEDDRKIERLSYVDIAKLKGMDFP